MQNFKYELSDTLFRLFELTGKIGYYNLFNNIEFDKEHILENMMEGRDDGREG